MGGWRAERRQEQPHQCDEEGCGYSSGQSGGHGGADAGYDARDVEKIWKDEFLPTFPGDMRPSKDDVPDGFSESVRNLDVVHHWIEENFVPLAEAA